MAAPFHFEPMVLGKRRIICAHRANYSGRYPSNSLAAVAECIEQRVPRLEVDVRFLADDAMLIYHDDRLEAHTTGTGHAETLDRAGARLVRYRHGEAHGLAFLEEVVDLLRPSSTMLQVDLKVSGATSPVRTVSLAETLAPIRDRLVVGCVSPAALICLAQHHLPLAFDPMLHLHHWPDRPQGRFSPTRLGPHGFWDDAPQSQAPAAAVDYLAARTADFLSLVPGVRELMVDIRTLVAMAALGFRMGEVLARSKVELAAWTLADAGPDPTPPLLRRLFELGTTTVITDHPREIAAYAAALP